MSSFSSRRLRHDDGGSDRKTGLVDTIKDTAHLLKPLRVCDAKELQSLNDVHTCDTSNQETMLVCIALSKIFRFYLFHTVLLGVIGYVAGLTLRCFQVFVSMFLFECRRCQGFIKGKNLVMHFN